MRQPPPPQQLYQGNPNSNPYSQGGGVNSHCLDSSHHQRQGGNSQNGGPREGPASQQVRNASPGYGSQYRPGDYRNGASGGTHGMA
jgi:hypothetical protein